MPAIGGGGGAVTADVDELVGVLLNLETRARNLDRVLPVVADILVSAVDDVYEAQGPNWDPFAPSTLRHRGDMGAAKLLQDTGVMAGSTMAEHGSNWAQAKAHVPYAKYHASGTATLPVRNPFDLGPFEAGVLDEVAELCLDEVVGG